MVRSARPRACIDRAVALALIATALVATPASARTPIAEMLCSLRSSMEARLANQFRAQRTAMGIRDADSVMEVWTEPGTGDWTMVVTYASGTSCIVAMGSAWEMQDASPTTSDAG